MQFEQVWTNNSWKSRQQLQILRSVSRAKLTLNNDRNERKFSKANKNTKALTKREGQNISLGAPKMASFS